MPSSRFADSKLHMRCSISRQVQGNKDGWGQLAPNKQVLFTDVPCRLYFSSVRYINTADLLAQSSDYYMLFRSNIVLKIGDVISDLIVPSQDLVLSDKSTLRVIECATRVDFTQAKVRYVGG